ncbi:MAG: co-chaperone GroES [Candidatus Delongbacteria bacterium]|nr:co-chaperone GroES [Candidatus Delongbacteria bacterium]MBN2837069.1 co-chaperone GroES [Candidatus Delongbacteria bacterium]
MATFKPIQTKVVVEITGQSESKTSGGIILPDSASKEKPQFGKVIAVGTDENLVKEISVGDEVIFGKYAGTEVTIEDKNYLILNFDEILTVVVK